MTTYHQRLCIGIFPLEWALGFDRAQTGLWVLNAGPFQIVRHRIREGAIFKPSRLHFHWRGHALHLF